MACTLLFFFFTKRDAANINLPQNGKFVKQDYRSLSSLKHYGYLIKDAATASLKHRQMFLNEAVFVRKFAIYRIQAIMNDCEHKFFP